MNTTVQHISVDELKILFDANSCQIIDVREAHEYEAAHIKGSKLVSLSEFEQKINLIDKNFPAYFLCGVGKRAKKAAEYLSSLGYKDLYIVEGGIKAWIEAGHEVTFSLK